MTCIMHGALVSIICFFSILEANVSLGAIKDRESSTLIPFGLILAVPRMQLPFTHLKLYSINF